MTRSSKPNRSESSRNPTRTKQDSHFHAKNSNRNRSTSSSSDRNLGPVCSNPKLVPSASSRIGSVFVGRVTLKPTIFRKQIKRLQDYPKTGDWVWVYATDRAEQTKPFACGLYNADSEIAVRIVRWFDGLPDDLFWDQKIHRAIELRSRTLRLSETTNAIRLIHGEADGFSGLVVDQYAEVLSAEVFSFAMYQRMGELMPRIAKMAGVDQWLVQPSPHFEEQEGRAAEPMTSGSLPDEVTVFEHDRRYRIQFRNSHKTGFFCDQRDNRQRLFELAKDKTVLDLCCYTGGFSVAAAKGGASEVVGVDLDINPIQIAKKNADINQVRIKFAQSDAFAYMRDLQRIGRRFDIVVLDPPKLITSRAQYELGHNKHFDLNKLAFDLVQPGGILLSCSCAGLLQEDDFIHLVRRASRATGFTEAGVPNRPRDVQILRRPAAPPDHPVAMNYPESDYLKSLWMRVS